MDKQATVFIAILALLVGIFAALASGAISFWVFLPLVLLGIILLLLAPEIVEVKEYERAVMFRFGKLRGVEGAGWFLHFPKIDKYVKVDLRVQAIDIAPQEVISRDNIKFKIDAVIYLKVTDPLKAVTAVQDFKQAATLNVYSQIRNAVSKMALEEVVVQTDTINKQLYVALAEASKDWGVQCIKVEIQTIEPPQSLVDAMRKRKEAQEYKAKLEIESEARGVQIDILNRAASKISDTTLAYLYLDALKKISEGKSNKIIFPLELSRLASLLSSKLGDQGAAPSAQMVTDAVRDAVAKGMPATQAKPVGKNGEATPELDYDKIVSDLLEAYRNKQAQVLGGKQSEAEGAAEEAKRKKQAEEASKD